MTRDRGFRRHQRERVINNRVKLMKDTDLEHQKGHQRGRYAKKHPYDCGNPDCYLCHGEKLLDKKKIEDIRVEDSYKEQVRDEIEDM